MAVVGILGQGGGVKLPSAIAAGDNPIYVVLTTLSTAGPIAAYVNVGTGYAFTALKAGTYRIKFVIRSYSGGNVGLAYARLTKNGTAVDGSEVFATGSASSGAQSLVGVFKSIDVVCAANDVIRLQHYTTTASQGTRFDNFSININMADLQTEINSVITIL